MRIGFIGLGNIGGGAARRLIDAGHDLVVSDLDSERLRRVVESGATAADNAEAAAQGTDVVFTSVPGPPQIRELAFGDSRGSGLLGVMAAGSTWIELSTNDAVTASAIRKEGANCGVTVLDAPVSGGPEGAQAGTLAIFVGAEEHEFDGVRPLLDVIGERVTHVGPPGAGVVAKIAQVTLCYTQTITLIEAMLLGVKGGVRPQAMLEMIQHSAGRSYAADVYGPEILAGTYDASFPLSHAAKDMRLATQLAEDLGIDLPFTEAVEELYARAEAEFGSTAAHCLAAQLLERHNDLLLHTVGDAPAPVDANPNPKDQT